MRALITFIVEVLQRRLFVRVVEDLAYRLPRVRQQAFDSQYGPELTNRFFDVVTVQKSLSVLLLDGIAILLQTVIGMAVLAFYHPFLIGFDVVLLVMIAFIIFVLGRGAVSTAIDESRAKYAVGAWLEELARHPTAFKLNAGTQFALDRADQLAVNWLDARRTHFRIVMRQILFALGLQALAATALLGLGGWLVILGELTLGQLVAAELIVMIIVGSFAKLGKYTESYYDLLASVDKLGHLFDLPTESHDKLFHLREDVPATVKLRDVTYEFGHHPVLEDLNFELSPGESVAVVGGAGCGKSTLVDLLCGIRQPSSGHVELDGIDLRELRPDSLREHVSAAGAVEIFHGSIDENVHHESPAHQCVRCARIACCGRIARRTAEAAGGPEHDTANQWFAALIESGGAADAGTRNGGASPPAADRWHLGLARGRYRYQRAHQPDERQGSLDPVGYHGAPLRDAGLRSCDRDKHQSRWTAEH